MPLDFISENLLLALALLAVFSIGAVALHVILRISASRIRRRAPDGLAYDAIKGLSNSAVLFLASLGIVLALRALPDLEPWQATFTRAWTVISVLLVARVLSNTFSVVASWYLRTVAPRTATQFDDRMVPILRRIVLVVIYGLAALIALDTLGVSITPLLGGLGITGLAVALALQPTLSNFFAGTYVLTDATIHPGDYIELQGGPSGYVIGIGWRSTKIRTWLNNLVIIPNSIVADTIVTNYQGPDPALNVLVTCGVSYSSDLAKVERVSLEVAREVLKDVPGAVSTEDPWFGYDSFGDSNIGFWIFLQAEDRIGSFVVTNELIKRLHARFAKESIEINYPMRKLVYPDEADRKGV
jgi:small-conductance mechanosensitive channel